MSFRSAVLRRDSHRPLRLIAGSLATLFLVIPLLILGVRGTPTLPATGAVTPHSTQATGYDLVGSDGGVGSVTPGSVSLAGASSPVWAVQATWMIETTMVSRSDLTVYQPERSGLADTVSDVID